MRRDRWSKKKSKRVIGRGRVRGRVLVWQVRDGCQYHRVEGEAAAGIFAIDI